MKQHKIGLGTMIAVCVGVVILQGAMITAMQGIAIGGLAFVSASIIAYILANFNAMSFAELALMYPEAGSIATYTKKALGDFPAIVSVFAGYVVVAMLGIPVEMFMVDALLQELFGASFPTKIVPLGILMFFVVSNYFGTDIFAKIQNVLSYSMVFAIVFVGVVALSGGIQENASLVNLAATFNQRDFFSADVLGLLAMAMWLLVGVEFLCPMINELANPRKNLPRAMFLSLLIMLVMFIVFNLGASFYMSKSAILAADIPYLDYSSAVFGQFGLIIAVIMGLTATCSTINTVLASIPRLLQGMAEHGQAFPQMKVMSKYNTPILAILFIATIIVIPVLTLSIDNLLTLVISAAISWLISYVINHINVIVLRKKYPDIDRPYKTPFYPLPQILGIAGMIFIIFNNAPTAQLTMQTLEVTGSILIVIAVIAFVWVKFFMKRKLFDTSD